MKLKKGSKEAKEYMASIRGMKKSASKKATKKAAPKKAAPKKAAPKKAAKKAAIKKQTGTSNRDRDLQRVAKLPGRRKSPSGGFYYESRRNRSDAPGSLLGIGYFDEKSITDLDQLRKNYYRLAKIYHPDAGGTKEAFQKLESDYQRLTKQILNGSSFSQQEKENETGISEDMSKIVNAIIGLPNITIEIIGRWIWVSGTTYPIRAELAAAGLEFIKKAGNPFWVYKGIESKSRGKMSIDEIRNKYGSNIVRAKENKKLSGVDIFRIPTKTRNKFLLALKSLTRRINKRPTNK